MTWKVKLLTLACALAAISGSCTLREPRTQVMLVIDADANVRALASDLQVTIEGRNALDQIDGPPATYQFRPKELSSTGWPFSIALVPRSGDLKRSYNLTAVISNGADVIAVMRAQSSFAARKTLALALTFSETCLNAASLNCSNQETCQNGACISNSVDVDTLAPYEVGSFSATQLAAGGGAGVVADNNSPAQAGTAGMSGETAAPAGDCGDGVLNAGELCDTGIVQGQGACPTACASAGCMFALLEGTGCQTTCVQSQITANASGDGCCPAGADSTTDSDCVPQCGNGRVESGETCEAGDPLHPCPTADSCRIDKCLIASITGDAALCTAICETRLIDQCVAGDGCCPSTCTHDLDSDCSASCGNGVVDATAGETCDPGSTATPCPSACDDGDVCTRDYLTGSAANCSASCLYVPITAPFSGDGCCPQGANANNDLDCAPACGNGVVEKGELCDLNCPAQVDCDDHNACTTDTVTGSDCNVKCAHTEVRAAKSGDGCCPPGANANNDRDCAAVCGNGVIENDEECDGDCPTSCGRSSLSCTQNVLTGAPCHRRCVAQRITSERNNDGCCPSGATAASDNDCAPVCGNGVVEGDEICDGNCGECESAKDVCSVVRRVNMPDVCHPYCVTSQREPSGRTRDGCCPSGATAASDNDCAPICGNGVVEGDEICDQNCGECQAPTNACSTVRRVNMPDECHPYCVTTDHGPSGRTRDGCCPSGASASDDADCGPVCGNGVVEGDEVCDGNCAACPMAVDPCVFYRRTNNPDACHYTCTRWNRGASGRTRDGCCPSGATPSDDADCSE